VVHFPRSDPDILGHPCEVKAPLPERSHFHKLTLNFLCFVRGMPGVLYYTTLAIHNVREIDKFRSKLVLILPATNTLALTNNLAYYGAKTL
jgi:hypothetical protein